MPEIMISIDPDECTGCGLCEKVCVHALIELSDGVARIPEPDRCILCGHCRAVCPEAVPILHPLDPGEFEEAPSPREIPDPAGLLRFFRARRSTRLFTKEPVEMRDLRRIIEAGRL